MPNERLPIRAFEQREIDNFRIEGAGSSEVPSWVLSGDELLSRAQDLFLGLNTAIESADHNPELPLVLAVDLDPQDTAKTKRKTVADMLEVEHNGSSAKIVGVQGTTRLVLQVENMSSARAIAERLEDAERFDQAISCITSIGRFTPEVEIPDECKTFKVRLVSTSNDGNRTSSAFEKYLEETGVQYRRRDYARGMSIYRISASPEQARAIADGAVGETVFSIRPMPKYRVALDSLAEDGDIPDLELPEDGIDYPVVGVLDSGITPIDHLSPWLFGSRCSPYPPSDIDPEHGTFVAGIITYGDRLEGMDWTSGISPKLLDAAVFPGDGVVDEDDLIESIRKAVKLNSAEVKVWNLSLSLTSPVRDNDFSDFGKALDDIQDEFGVLICKSAGNCQPDKTGRKGRILAGADSVRCLTVGSVAHNKRPEDLAEAGQASPFSRIGPGPEFIIKPEVSHYGGNAGFDTRGTMSTNPVRSFSPDGGGALAVGTSFSTPRVSRLAANLQSALGGEFDPLLTRALIMHSSTFPGDSLVPDDRKVNEMGFGVPARIEDILADNEHSATLVLRGTLDRGKKIDIMEFPMPNCLIRDGRYTGQITLTVAYDPILDSSQGGEYCQSNIDVRFGAYDQKKERDIRKPMILNPIGRNRSINVLLTSNYSKRKLKDASTDFALRERMLVQYAGKYAPVKKYAIDLEDLRPSVHEQIEPDWSWFLNIEGLFRDNVERRALRDGVILSQPFCVVVTVKDPAESAPVYDNVTALLEQNNFLYEDLTISNRAIIETGIKY